MAEPGPTRRAAARRSTAAAHQRTSVIAALVALAIVLGLGALVLAAVRPRLPLEDASSPPPTQEASPEPTDYPGPGEGEVIVEVPEGSDALQLGQLLADAGVVLTPEAFAAALAADGGTEVGPGSYRLLREMTAKDALAALRDPARRQDLQLTIPVGYRSDQIYTRIADVLGVPLDQVQAAAADYAALGLEAPPNAAPEAVDPLEGWLLAGTYTVTRDATPAQVLRQMYDATIETLDAAGVDPADRGRVLTIASIAGQEATSPAEAPRVVRVIENRLLPGSPTDGRLQVESTLNYVWESTHPLKEKMDPAAHDTDTSVYNTRIHAGLPPSPIASVDATLIAAAVQPEEGPWLYYVPIDLCTGETAFTDSSAEFIAKQEEFRAWLDRYAAGGSVCPVPEG